MDGMEKPPLIKANVIAKAVFAGILAVIGILLILGAFSTYSSFLHVKEADVKVEAEIVDVKKGTDSDGYDEYDMYIAYEYEGESYTVFYGTSGDSDTRSRVGEMVTVRIDPKNPSKLLNQLSGGASMLAYWAVFLLGLAVCVIFIFPARETYIHAYGQRSVAIRRDLISLVRRRTPICFTLPAGILWIAVSVCFWKDSTVILPFLFGVGCLGISIYMLPGYLRRLRKVRAGEYRIYVDELLSESTSKDSDGDTQYNRHYGGSGRYWKISSSVKKFADQYPSQIRAVYLDGMSAPIAYFRDRHSDLVPNGF